MQTNILVVGATGIIGSAFLRHCLGNNGTTADDKGNKPDAPVSGAPIPDATNYPASEHWHHTALTRRPEITSNHQRLTYLHVDLLGDCSSLRELTDITHVVFAGYVPETDSVRQLAQNTALLKNCLDALEQCSLEQVVLLQGMKYYGSHKGRFRTPARENDARLNEPHYYYAQQDLVEASGIPWTCLRPHVVCGTASIGTPQNILCVLGCYVSLCKSMNFPLHWPGNEASFHALNQATDATLLAKAIVWALQSPAAQKQAFNVTNGDFFRWQHLWPKIAEQFGVHSVGCKPQQLQETMSGMGQRWEELVQTNNLQPFELAKICDWSFADYILKTEWDVMASTTKIRLAGFDACLDTEAMYLAHLKKMQHLRVIP